MTEAGQAQRSRAFWNQRLGPFQSADNRAGLLQLTSTLLLFALAWWVMYRSLDVGWWLTLALAPLASLLLVRLFIIQHDCGHRSFFSSRRANDVVGFWLGVLTLTPYRYWRKAHAIHHGTFGNLDRRSFGDVTTLTVQEYLALPRLRRLAYRLYRNPLVMLGIGPIWVFILKHRLPLDAPRSWAGEWRSVLATNAVLVLVLLLAAKTIGLGAFLAVQLPITLLAGPIGVWLFYVQHQFEGTYWARGKDWDFFDASLKGSSFYDLPALLHWFTGNIGFHHIHHLSSLIPNYKLQRCYREVEELQQVPALGVLASLRTLRLRLWDEDAQRMVGFKQLAHRGRDAAARPEATAS